MRDDYLFNKYDLRGTLDNIEKRLYESIDALRPDQILNSSVEDLVTKYKSEYIVNLPQLLEEEISVDQNELMVDVSRDHNRYISNRSQPFLISGTKVTYYVPFKGDRMLFECQSSMLSMNPPRGSINDSELVLTYETTNHNVDAIKTEFNNTLSQIKSLLVGTGNDVGIFNDSLEQKVRSKINTRREKILKDQGLVSELGFPLRKRNDASLTYVVPVEQKKIVPTLPPTTQPFKPEPTLEMAEYENILSIMSNMVNVMERSPKAFYSMGEEDLRQHFLVQLNGQYQGQATGETFNGEGKTDILIRADGKNIFIAECKIWDGPKYFEDAIKQLLSYTSWRDTKTAILIFNRNKNLSEVLEKIPTLVKNHPNFKREVDYSSETGFRYILHHNNDKNREIILTVSVFEIPKEESSK